MSTSLLSKESSTSPAMSEDEHEDVVPPDPRGKWTSPSRNLFPPELGMSSHGLGNLSLYSMKRLERQCCMHASVQPRTPACEASSKKRKVNLSWLSLQQPGACGRGEVSLPITMSETLSLIRLCRSSQPGQEAQRLTKSAREVGGR